MIKVAVIGCGYWGPNLVRNFYKSKDCKIVAVADLDTKRLDYIRKLFPSLETTTDTLRLLHHQDIDAIVVATPVSTHYDLAKEALLADKHVLVSKPLTQTSTEAEQLIALAEKHHRVLMVDHTFIYTGAARKIRELIDQGELGDIYYFDSVRVNLGLFQSDVNVVWDLGPHDFSIMDYVLSAEPISISAVGINAIPYSDNGHESVAYVTVRLRTGVIAHLHLSWLSPVKIRQTLISGSRRMIVYDHLDYNHQVKIYDKGVEICSTQDRYQAIVQYRTGDMYSPKVDQTEPLEIECQQFVDCCLGNVEPISNGHSGLRVVRLLEAAQQSMKRGGEVISLDFGKIRSMTSKI